MIKIKILEILEKLSPEELKEFSDYLNSPLFNKRKIIAGLFDVYKNYYPGFDDTGFVKEKVFAKLFPKRDYNDTVFRNLNSLLLSHAENFLSLKNYLKDPALIKNHLLSELNSKNIFSLFDKNFREGLNQLEKSEVRDSEFFLNEYNLYLQKDLYNSFVNKFSKDDITSSGMSFMKFYIMKLMEIQNYILYECRILGLDNTLFIDADYIDKTLKIMPVSIRNMPQVKIYYNALMLERKQSKKYYNELKSLLFEFGNLLEKEKLYNKYIDLIDFIKRSRKSNDLGSLREIFLLRKRIVENGLMPENFITNMFFLNLVTSALRLEEFDWTFEFIEKYNTNLLPDHRESVRNLSYSLYYFNKKDFQKALSFSAKVGYEDVYYNLQVKNIAARIYFELNETDLLINHISSYRMYLAKNRTLSRKEVLSHSLFVNFIDKLYKVKEKKKLYKLSELISKAGKTEFISRNWIIDKAHELDK
ncbi:MAG: hypothetical protein IPM38_03305 [Ignavibacteria bacterium]|nr:hypothetical protein [Ignavibacteria bacterium]